MTRNFPDWLEEFVRYTSVGEAPEHVMWWVGVSTIAGAIRRRVWVPEDGFDWVPNFYIVVVAEPGIIAKTTTANRGFNLLRKVPGIHFGPDIVTWERMLQKMGEIGEFVEINGVQKPMHAMTCAIDELGTFLDPDDRDQVDALVGLWDGQERPFTKETKTQGNDVINNPWLNIFACTTPAWKEQNFPAYFLDTGLFSRLVILEAKEKRELIAYPSRRAKSLGVNRGIQEAKLIADLQQIATLAGPMVLTEAAYQWGERFYEAHWEKMRTAGRELRGYPSRKQTHLHKLALIIAVSRGKGSIDVPEMEEAERQLVKIEPGMASVFGRIGSPAVAKSSGEIVDALEKMGGKALRREVFNKHFFRRLSLKDFSEAVNGAEAAGLIFTSADKTWMWLPVKGAGL